MDRFPDTCCFARPGPRRRRGTVYLVVLGVSMLVTVIGVSALLAVRVQRRELETGDDAREARLYAEAAVDHVLATLPQAASWRSLLSHDTWSSDFALGRGTFRWKLLDEADADLADNPTDPLTLVAWGMVGDTVQKLSAEVSAPPAPPLDSLATALHCGGELFINGGGDWLSLHGGPAVSNDLFHSHGTLFGDVEATGVHSHGSGVVSGTMTIPAQARSLPPAYVIDKYIAAATSLPFSGDLDEDVLTSGVNQYGGGLNAGGMYFIDTGDADIKIKATRLRGTLIVDAGSGTVVVGPNVMLEANGSGRPVLIVVGDLQLVYESRGSDDSKRMLRESDFSHNFNPPGAPYMGSTDADWADKYPCRISGLVHCTGNLTATKTPLVRGTVICEGLVTIDGEMTILHRPELVSSPPYGYTEPVSLDLVITGGTWRQVVD